MRRFISLVGAIGLGALSIVACSDDDLIVGPPRPLTPDPGSAGRGGSGAAGRGGSGGSEDNAGSGGSSAGSGGSSGRGGSSAGSAGEAGTDAGGAETDAGSDGGVDEPDASGPVLADAGISCSVSADCDDSNDCTGDVCTGQVCVFTPLAIGSACGDSASEDECTQPDTCDGAGVCLPNHQPDGTLCEAGHCNTEGACDCAVERVTAVPYGQQWQTTSDTELDVYTDCQTCAGTLDHVVVFTAPTSGTYRFTAASGGDAELAVFEGDCADTLVDASCGADIDEDNEDYADRLELELDAGATVTVVVGESCEENGGVGNLDIELLPSDG
ncbi:MAG TPA: hypothetical protein VMG12_22695 [Polyangiaceae bacterium]|nr:hypothetical protein [Polyangiaceae bacterium]